MTTKPLTSSSFYILLAVVDEPRHGLGIASEVETRTGGDVRMGPGTLYIAIKKLLDQKLIAEVSATPDDDPGAGTTRSPGPGGARSPPKRESSTAFSSRRGPRKCCRDASALQAVLAPLSGCVSRAVR